MCALCALRGGTDGFRPGVWILLIQRLDLTFTIVRYLDGVEREGKRISLVTMAGTFVIRPTASATFRQLKLLQEVCWSMLFLYLACISPVSLLYLSRTHRLGQVRALL